MNIDKLIAALILIATLFIEVVVSRMQDLLLSPWDMISNAAKLLTQTTIFNMKKDYAYCVGPNYFGGPGLCENCKRHISFNTEVQETLTWTMPMYDDKTGKCPLHEPKDNITTANERISMLL